MIAEAEDEGLPSVVAPRQRRASALPTATPGEHCAPAQRGWPRSLQNRQSAGALLSLLPHPCGMEHHQLNAGSFVPYHRRHGAPHQPAQVCCAGRRAGFPNLHCDHSAAQHAAGCLSDDGCNLQSGRGRTNRSQIALRIPPNMF